MGDRVTGGRRLKPRPFPLLSKGVFATGAEPSRTRVCWRRERILDGEHQSPQCKVQEKAGLRPVGICVTYVAGLKCHPCRRSVPFTSRDREGAVGGGYRTTACLGARLGKEAGGAGGAAGDGCG